MNKVVLQFPTRVAVEFAGGDTTDTNIGGFLGAFFLAPLDATFGSEASDIAKVFKISPKFNLGTRFLMQDFTCDGDCWCDVPPGPAADY